MPIRTRSILKGNDLGIDLARTHNKTSTGSPVWRIKIYRNTRNTRPDGRGQNVKMQLEHLAHMDPDDPQPRFPLPDVDRTVYFMQIDPNDSTVEEALEQMDPEERLYVPFFVEYSTRAPRTLHARGIG